MPTKRRPALEIYKTIDRFKARATALMGRISKDRDELRALINEIDAVANSADRAESNIQSALDNLKRAMESLSEYL